MNAVGMNPTSIEITKNLFKKEKRKKEITSMTKG